MRTFPIDLLSTGFPEPPPLDKQDYVVQLRKLYRRFANIVATVRNHIVSSCSVNGSNRWDSQGIPSPVLPVSG